jgi:hypothetical protein
MTHNQVRVKTKKIIKPFIDFKKIEAQTSQEEATVPLRYSNSNFSLNVSAHQSL